MKQLYQSLALVFALLSSCVNASDDKITPNIATKIVLGGVMLSGLCQQACAQMSHGEYESSNHGATIAFVVCWGAIILNMAFVRRDYWML